MSGSPGPQGPAGPPGSVLVPADLISIDANNSLRTGSDNKLFNPQGALQTIAATPAQQGTLTFNSNTQTPSWRDFDPNELEVSGAQTGLNAGTYTVHFTPKPGFAWSDRSTDPKSVNWTINRAAGSFSVLPALSPFTVNGGITQTITVTRAGDGVITASSSNTGIYTVSVSGNNVNVTRSAASSSNASVTITINVAQGTNHLVPSPASRTQTVSANIAVPVTSFTASLHATNNTVALSWGRDTSNMGSAQTTMIRRSYTSIPLSITDGTEISNSTTATSFTDTITQLPVYYAAFGRLATANPIASTSRTQRIDPQFHMQEFFAIPGRHTSAWTSSVQLKIEFPRLWTAPIHLWEGQYTWIEEGHPDNWLDGWVFMYRGQWNSDNSSKGPNQWATIETSRFDDNGQLGDRIFLVTSALWDIDFYMAYNIDYIYAAFSNSNITRIHMGGLEVEYTMDSVSGTTVNDTSGNNRNATLNATNTIFVAGKVGNAMQVNTTTTLMANLGLTAGYNMFPNSDFTVTFWVDTRVGNQIFSIIANTTNFDSALQFSLRYNSTSGLWITRSPTQGTYTDIAITPTIPLSAVQNREFFMCIRRVGGNLQIRVDNHRMTVSAFNIENTNTRIFRLANVPANPMHGRIDQVRMWSRSLEDFEVDNLYNGGKGC